MVNIIERRNIFFVFSSILVGLSFLALIVWGLKPSIDFTGGSLIEVLFEKERPNVPAIQSQLGQEFGDVLVQATGDKGYIFKLRYVNEDEHQRFLTVLRNAYSPDNNLITEKRVETIGPAVSSVLKRRSWLAGFTVVLAIVLFIAYSFRKVSQPIASWKFGVAAIVALVHDVSITMGFFAILGHFWDVHVDIPFVVALLTILGYSVNDTIVVFDRIREKLMKRVSGGFAELTNSAVNETLWRSFNTSATVLLALSALHFFGGDSTKYFTLALLVGIFFGTYSSIFLASPFLVAWEKWDRSRK